MIDRNADPRTEDTLVFELLRTPRGSSKPEIVGLATFRGGRSTIEAPEAVKVAVDELLTHAFVDRVQADERPRGYRRSGRGIVDRLVPGMAEHFIARLRGLWLSYPDGTVVTAREATRGSGGATLALPDASETAPPITDATTRRSTLMFADRMLGTRPLAGTHAPEVGVRPPGGVSRDGAGTINRTDCGWIA